MSEESDSSIVGKLPPFSWSDGEAVSYEVALEGINHVIGLYSALISRGRKEGADPGTLERWRSERQRWADRRRTLSAADVTEVRQVQRECAALIARLGDNV